MTSHIANAGSEFIAKKAKGAGGEYVTKKLKPKDPLYETSTHKGKTKKTKRGMPPNISDDEAKILKSVRTRAHYLDNSVKIMGLNFGLAALLGLIPGIGDFADVILSVVLVLCKARQAKPPKAVMAKMVFNCALAGAVGFVPIVGDIVVGMLKPNSRNAFLLEEWLRERGEETKTESELQSSVRDQIKKDDVVREAYRMHTKMVGKKEACVQLQGRSNASKKAVVLSKLGGAANIQPHRRVEESKRKRK